MSESRIREEIWRLGRSLFERGLTPGSSGNISVKLDDGGWLVTPTNASLGFLDPARLSRLSADGKLVSGDAPTKEVPLHSALYQTPDAARAVVHLHSTHSVALSMLPEIDPPAALPPMTPYYLMKCGHTALVPYYRPADPGLAVLGEPRRMRPPALCWSPLEARKRAHLRVTIAQAGIPQNLQPQIRLPHVRIFRDLRRPPLHQHAAGLQDVGAVGDLQAFRH